MLAVRTQVGEETSHNSLRGEETVQDFDEKRFALFSGRF